MPSLLVYRFTLQKPHTTSWRSVIKLYLSCFEKANLQSDSHVNHLYMNSLPQPSLEKEYQKWNRNQHILEQIKERYASTQQEEAQWKAALENAIMYAVLRQSSYNPDLMLELSPQSIQHGLECVSLDSHADQSESLHQLIQNTAHDMLDHENGAITAHRDDRRFTVGQFQLERNSYIDKAFDFLASQKGAEEATRLLLTAAIRYASIYAETRHIGPPQSVYDDFYDWGIRNEGFASPFNARLLGKEEAQFYSLFPDTDQVFGSGGSFFRLSEPANPGHWSLDPPFLPETMQKVDQRIGEWRKRFPDTSILYIIPESHQPEIKPDETVTLKSGEHHYEGLSGIKKPLPVNVCIHRYGDLSGFSAQRIQEGYEK